MQRRLHAMLEKEEYKLQQLSRIQWLHSGDRNTRFFFSSLKSRIAANTRSRVKLSDGSFEKECQVIKDLIVKFQTCFVLMQAMLTTQLSLSRGFSQRKQADGLAGISLLKKWNLQ